MNKRQRLATYKKMLKWFEGGNYDNYYPCFCSAIRVIDFRARQELCIYNFPELMKYKPDPVVSGYWFEVNERGIEKRKQILRKIIKEMS